MSRHSILLLVGLGFKTEFPPDLRLYHAGKGEIKLKGERGKEKINAGKDRKVRKERKHQLGGGKYELFFLSLVHE
jgi:hypothetical protein